MAPSANCVDLGAESDQLTSIIIEGDRDENDRQFPAFRVRRGAAIRHLPFLTFERL
jgi:hypothetical protein